MGAAHGWRKRWLAVVPIVACVFMLGVGTGLGLAARGPKSGATGLATASQSTPTRSGLTRPSPSETPAQNCPPPWSVCTSTSAIGNFEGTGQKEVLTAAPLASQSGGIADWSLSVGTAAGAVSARLSSLVAGQGGCPGLTDIGYAKVLGAADFAGPTRDLGLVEVSHGASTRFAVLVGLEAGKLQLIAVASGAEKCQRLFPFGGSVTHGNGLACGWSDNTPVLWVSQVSDNPPDYTDYDWYQATYTWQGLKLYLQTLDHAVITSTDVRFAPSYSALCGSIDIPD